MDKNRLYWASRRGMLELDLILEPFLDNHFDALSDEDKLLYEQLLEEQDPDLFQWFMRGAQPDTDGLKHIVEIIRRKTTESV